MLGPQAIPLRASCILLRGGDARRRWGAITARLLGERSCLRLALATLSRCHGAGAGYGSPICAERRSRAYGASWRRHRGPLNSYPTGPMETGRRTPSGGSRCYLSSSGNRARRICPGVYTSGVRAQDSQSTVGHLPGATQRLLKTMGARAEPSPSGRPSARGVARLRAYGTEGEVGRVPAAMPLFGRISSAACWACIHPHV